jgi:transposase
MSKFDLKPKAHKLRIGGLSIGMIAKELNLSKSTVSLWCSEIKISNDAKKALKEKMILAGHKGRLLGAEANKNKKTESILQAKTWAEEKVKDMSQRDCMIACTSLYWAEGSKTKSTTGFVFVNSDPKMISFVYKWLIKSGLVLKEDFKPRLSINIIHKPRVNTVLNFWSNLLELPLAQFSNVCYINKPPKKFYANHNNYFGVLRLEVRRSTNLKYKILALIEQIKA